MNAAAKKFTARQFAALESLAREHGLTHTEKCDSKNYDFAVRAPVDGFFLPVTPEDAAAALNFCRAANDKFGDRAHFDAWTARGGMFARVTWSQDTRSEVQIANMD